MAGRRPRPAGWRAQQGDELGRRIEAALTELLAERTGAVLLGSDHPTVSGETLIAAVTALEAGDAVLGPTLDGGYYLVGMRATPPPGLFSGITWSTERVLVETLARMRDVGLKPVLLPPWYDVDTVQDLRFLDVHLQSLHLADPETNPCPATRKVLSEIRIK